tara:strand:- start:479 stop:775 length:297 start_codon:yes stop_codon:yes gene_type:complete
MIDKLKALLLEYKISVGVISGALVIGAVWGTCSFEPETESVSLIPEVTTENENVVKLKVLIDATEGIETTDVSNTTENVDTTTVEENVDTENVSVESQ